MKDQQIKKIIQAETARQKKVINLIPSENYVSDDVMEAVGSVFDNKYAEGYPNARYYGGSEQVDQIESLCQKRALDLFNLSESDWHVNCQAHSGSPANLAVYLALVPHATFDATGALLRSPGKIMGMTLTAGGHLTHGQKVSASGKFWQTIGYGVDPDTEVIDYIALKKQALKEKPDLIVAGFTAYPRTVDFAEFRKIAEACGALLMVDMSHLAGLVAGHAYPSPFPYADVVTTTTHKTLRGPRGALIFAKKNFLDKKGIFVNGNTTAKSAKAVKRGEVHDLGKKIDKAVFPGLQGGPHMSHIAGIAIALGEAKTPAFKKYAKQVVKNASTFSKEMMKLGWRVVSEGTDSHLLLIDTWMGGHSKAVERKVEEKIVSKGNNAKAGNASCAGKADKIDKKSSIKTETVFVGAVPGKVAEAALEVAGIICNKNTIPGEMRSPFDPSGIRVGTPAETTRGKVEKDFIVIAQKIDEVLRSCVEKS